MSTLLRLRRRRSVSPLVYAGGHTYGVETLIVHSWNSETVARFGRYCSLAPAIELFLGGNHRVDWTSTFPFALEPSETDLKGSRDGHPSSRGDIVVGNDVWIGTGASIMSGVHIADGAVVAAKSHVVADVAPYSIVGGNPAKELRRRFSPAITARLLELKWWEWPDDQVREARHLLAGPPTEDSVGLLEVMAHR